MHARTLGLIGAAISMATAPLATVAAETADVKQLQEENRRLAEQLKSAQAELKRVKESSAPPAATSAPQTRNLNSPMAVDTSSAEAAPSKPAPAPEKKDFYLAIGTKVWITEWSTWRTPGTTNLPDGSSKGTNIQTLTSRSSSEPSVIPSLTARYKDFFFTGSYLSKTTYQFPAQSQIYGVPSVDVLGTPTTSALGLNYQLEGTRKEWDVSLGYQIIPYLAVTAGYKQIDQSFKTLSCAAVDPTDGFSIPCVGALDARTVLPDVKVSYGGPTLGLSGAAPIGNGFGLYGSFTYGWLGANYQKRSPTADAVNGVDYYVGEMGLTYTHLMKEMPVYMPLSSATAYAGYRYQSYKSHLERATSLDNNPKDTVQGFVAGVNLGF